MQKALKLITLQGAIKKSPILRKQYWKNKWLDSNIFISYSGGSNNIFANCISTLVYICIIPPLSGGPLYKV